MVGLGLQSAIREQRRDRKYITSDYVEVEPDNLVYEIDQFISKSGRLSPSVAESDDFDVINEWIREPDCSEMLSNAEANQSSQEDLFGGICNNSDNKSMEDGDSRIVANAAENESRGVIDTEEMKPICEEFGQSSAKTEAPPNEVENVEVKLGMVCLGGHAVGNDGEILSEKPPTEGPAGQGTVFPIHIQSGTTSSNGVSEISVDNGCTHLEAREESIEYISSAWTREDTKEMLTKSPSFFEGQEAKVPKREETMRAPIYEESEAESGEIVSEDDGRDYIGVVESDRDSSSNASSRGSDDEDEEEGEIRSSNGRRSLRADSLDEMLGSSDEEGPKGGPIRSMHELQALPPVPSVNVVLEDHHQTLPLGTISSVLTGIVLVEGTECHSPLDEGSILWITEKRLPLGSVDEVFGPVKNPYYVVRFNSAADVPEYVREGTKISYVSEYAICVLNDPSLYKKGYDASGEHDEELSEEVEFSDDEKEADYNRTRLKTKRGANSRENMQGTDYCKFGKSHGFADKRKNKIRSGRSHKDGNRAHSFKGEAQEIRFASKMPFQNSSRGWNSSVGAKQSKDCGKYQGPAPPCMPPTGQSAGGQLTAINNIAQQSPQHFDPTRGSLSQAAIPVAYPGPPTHQVQSPVVGSQSTSQLNANSPGFFHSRPLHDTVGGIPMGHLPTRLLQDPAGGIHLGQPHSRPLHDPAGGIHLGQPHFRPLHDPVGGAHLVQAHSRPLQDPSEGIQTGQPNSRPSLQDTVAGIPLGQSLHDPAGVIHLGQPPMFGGLMLNGNQINTNPLDLHQRPMHPVYMGSPLHDNSIRPRMPFSSADWNAGPANHLAEGAQLQPSDANQGIISPLHYNKTHACFGAPLSHRPGSVAPLYANMGMNTFCNTGPFPGQNVMSCPMPMGQFAPIIQGNPNWQYQNCVLLDGGSVPISQPNNIMPVNAPRPPLPHGPPPQGANFGHWRPN